jgi:hypothetical protein
MGIPKAAETIMLERDLRLVAALAVMQVKHPADLLSDLREALA